MASESRPRSGPGRGGRRYTRLFVRAPPPAVGTLLLLALDLAVAVWLWPVPGGVWGLVEWFALAFAFPSLVAAYATPWLAGLLGGRFSLRRSIFLGITSTLIVIPVIIVARVVLGGVLNVPGWVPSAVLFLQGPLLWFRHMSLYGVSKPSHLRSLPVSLLQPVLSVIGVFALVPATVALSVESVAFLALGFGCSVLLMRSTDRPLRREFGVSGIGLIRPFLDHISGRDPDATQTLEAFFRRFAQPADLRVSVAKFVGPKGAKATLALPTVHPGPFAALGASDLPRKVAEALAPASGVVFVPHTPCDHDLDLPSATEVDILLRAARDLDRTVQSGTATTTSPLTSPRPGSFARAQALGPMTLVLLSQAPEPTDDIAFAVVDRVYRQLRASGGREVLFVDAHNSYKEDEGDLVYGTPKAEQLEADALAAVAAAEAAATPGPLELGAAQRGGYTTREQGIGPQGIRALAIRTAGRTTAYVLIDGNNLLAGLRAPILEALRGVVDDAEVMTTDNHVVHELDGSLNPVGERYSVELLARDIRAVVEQAVADLSPVEVAVGTVAVPAVPVLGPGFTARLLTSLGDTVASFQTALTLTFLLLLSSSLVVLLATGVS